eukprot:gene31930-8929_t
MLDTQAKPQILEHLTKSLTVTIYETKYVTALADAPHLSYAPYASHAPHLAPAPQSMLLH